MPEYYYHLTDIDPALHAAIATFDDRLHHIFSSPEMTKEEFEGMMDEGLGYRAALFKRMAVRTDISNACLSAWRDDRASISFSAFTEESVSLTVAVAWHVLGQYEEA